MTDHLHFYDSATSENVPTGVHAAIYVNGTFAWSRAEADRMAKVFRISVEQDASWARLARCIDVESGDATPLDAVAFVHHRRSLGFDDATVYVNRSNLPTVASAMKSADLSPPRYWVATLDGTMDVAGAWAVQYQGGMNARFDVSILYGRNDFHRP